MFVAVVNPDEFRIIYIAAWPTTSGYASANVVQSKVNQPATLCGREGNLSPPFPAVVVALVPADVAVLEKEVPPLKNTVWPCMTPVGDVGRGEPVVAHALQVVHEDRTVAERAVHFLAQDPLSHVREVRVDTVIVAPLGHGQVVTEDGLVADQPTVHG